MELRKICDDPNDMAAWEMAHNMMFVKDREAWYRDFEREIPLLDLVREIYEKHAGEDGLTQDMEELDGETLDEILADNLQYGTDDWDGVIALFYQTAWGAAELREWLKAYETHALRPPCGRRCCNRPLTPTAPGRRRKWQSRRCQS